MKKIVVAISLMVVGYIAAAQKSVSIIPAPQFLKVHTGSFSFYKNTQFIAPAGWKPIAQYLQQITNTSIKTLQKGNTRIIFKENKKLATQLKSKMKIKPESIKDYWRGIVDGAGILSEDRTELKLIQSKDICLEFYKFCKQHIKTKSKISDHRK